MIARALPCLTLVFAALVGQGCGVDESLGTSRQAIVGGELDSDDPAVLALTVSELTVCSGELVGPHSVLTAGHCIEPLGAGAQTIVTLGSDATHPTRRIRVVEQRRHPSFTAQGKPFDVGMLELAEAVSDVTPLVPAYPSIDDTWAGRAIRHVGYGASDEATLGGLGQRRTVTYPITRIDASFVYSNGTAAQTCSGDSGGAALVTVEGAERLVAVVSDGPDCHSEGWDQRLDVARDWIESTRQAFDPPPPKPPHQGCAATQGPLGLVALGLVAFRLSRRAASASSSARGSARA